VRHVIDREARTAGEPRQVRTLLVEGAWHARCDQRCLHALIEPRFEAGQNDPHLASLLRGQVETIIAALLAGEEIDTLQG
jgi:hypothetical protein